MKNVLKYWSVGVMMILMFFNITIGTFADTDKDMEQIQKAIAQDGFKNCKENLSKAYNIRLFEFQAFLEINFQNKSSNSSLTNIAIARYRDYKLAIRDLFAQLQAAAGSLQQENSAYPSCVTIMQEYIEAGKNQLLSHVKKNSSQKKTAILLEKYQAINSKLRDLNVEIAEMYSYFMAFKEKLPGFLQECIQSN